MRVERYFAFTDLSGFTQFTDTHGDDRSVDVLTEFRGATRRIATDFGVRIAKWLGDGCMLVSVEADQLVAAVMMLDRLLSRKSLPLSLHAGMAGGKVILLDGDDYTGTTVNLASRLCDAASPRDILATSALAAVAPDDVLQESIGPMEIQGLQNPVDVVRLTRP
jgi:adenylate cyclase